MSSLFKKLADMFFRNSDKNSHGFFSGKTQYGDPKKMPEVIDKENKQTDSEGQHNEKCWERRINI